MDDVPMNTRLYYHFLSSNHAIHDLERRMIRVSLLDTLNDPFELMPYLRYRKADKRRRIQSTRESFSKRYGLLCFSGDWSEPLLWGHYADKHRGAALGFEVLQGDVIQVNYSKDPIRQQVELTGDRRNDERLFSELARIKYHRWEYEDEYRLLVALRDCTEVDGHQFLRFDKRLRVKELMLGCKYDNNVKYTLKLAKAFGANVIPTRMQWQGYKIRRCGSKTKKYQKLSASIE